MSQKNEYPIDYQSYKQFSHELAQPIDGRGLNTETLKRLYESKLLYIEMLRLKCFKEMNGNPNVKTNNLIQCHHHTKEEFTHGDYEFILQAQIRTKEYLRHVVRGLIKTGISQLK